MTNKQYLLLLVPEELVCSPYFVDCPYTYIYKEEQKKKGIIICEKDEKLKELDGCEQIAEFVFSGKQRAICNACKLKWLSEETRSVL